MGALSLALASTPYPEGEYRWQGTPDWTHTHGVGLSASWWMPSGSRTSRWTRSWTVVVKSGQALSGFAVQGEPVGRSGV